MRIVMRGRGRVRVIETTALDFRSSMLLTADFLSAVDFEKNGLLLDRCCYTSVNDGRQSLKRDPVELASPDELKAYTEIEVDGLLFAAREGERLLPAMIDQIYDEDGNMVPPPARGIRIYYRSGSYESIDATGLLYAEGFIASDDVVDFSELPKRITWDRGQWTVSDAVLMSSAEEAAVVIEEDTLGAVSMMTVEGEVVWPSDEGEEDSEDEETGMEEQDGDQEVRQDDEGRNE